MNAQQRKTLREYAQRLSVMVGPDKVAELEAIEGAWLAARDAYVDYRNDLQSELEDIKNDIEEMREEEQGKFDNMSEGLQQGQRGQEIEQAAQTLGSAVDTLDSLMDKLQGAEPEEDREDIVSGIGDVRDELVGI